MKREFIALVPVLGVSLAFLTNQSCTTKTTTQQYTYDDCTLPGAVATIKRETKEPKENLKAARKNLDEAKGFLAEAESILRSAKNRLETHIANKPIHTPPPPPPPPPAYGEIKVGWCDTLWDISAKVYDNALYWTAIYNLNKDKIGDDPWILIQGKVLKYKIELTEEEKEEALKESLEWAMKFKDRKRVPKCPPK